MNTKQLISSGCFITNPSRKDVIRCFIKPNHFFFYIIRIRLSFFHFLNESLFQCVVAKPKRVIPFQNREFQL